MGMYMNANLNMGYRTVDHFIARIGLPIETRSRDGEYGVYLTHHETKWVVETIDAIRKNDVLAKSMELTSHELMQLGLMEAIMRQDWSEFISKKMDVCPFDGWEKPIRKQRRKYVRQACREYRLWFA